MTTRRIAALLWALAVLVACSKAPDPTAAPKPKTEPAVATGAAFGVGN